MDLMRLNTRFLMKTKAQTNRKVQSSIPRTQVHQDRCLISTNGRSMQIHKKNKNLRKILLKILLSEFEKMSIFQMSLSNIKTRIFDQEENQRSESHCESELESSKRNIMRDITKNLEIHLNNLKIKTKSISTSTLSWTDHSQCIRKNQKLQNKRKKKNSTLKN